MENVLEKEILSMIIERLELEDIDVENFDYDTQLFATEEEEGLGLDSVDSLEVIVGLKKSFGVVIGEEELDTYKTINMLAEYIRSQTTALE